MNEYIILFFRNSRVVIDWARTWLNAKHIGNWIIKLWNLYNHTHASFLSLQIKSAMKDSKGIQRKQNENRDNRLWRCSYESLLYQKTNRPNECKLISLIGIICCIVRQWFIDEFQCTVVQARISLKIGRI